VLNCTSHRFGPMAAPLLPCRLLRVSPFPWGIGYQIAIGCRRRSLRHGGRHLSGFGLTRFAKSLGYAFLRLLGHRLAASGRLVSWKGLAGQNSYASCDGVEC
jgi:hypothetical protein